VPSSITQTLPQNATLKVYKDFGKKILVIGGGGREHAIVWSLSKSADVNEIVRAPGRSTSAARQSTSC
jgi:shikimate 5-dehydrogenase